MNIYILLAIIPVVLAVALIVALIRRNITENRGGGLDIAPAIPAIVVLMIAILVIAPMAESTQDYLYDEDSGELVIQKNIQQLDIQPWDGYSDEVTSLVIKDGVTIGSGAFDSLTSLEHIRIGSDVSFGSNVFGVSLKDYMGASVSSVGEGDYAGPGDGNVYLCDESIFTYGSANTVISGLTTAASSAIYIVLPAEHAGTRIAAVAGSAFSSKTSIAFVGTVMDSDITLMGSSVFNGCTSLASVMLPESLENLGAGAFKGCTSLASLEVPDSVTTIGNGICEDCSALVSAKLPARVSAIPDRTFVNCAQLADFAIPSTVTSIGTGAFTACVSLTEISFPEGLRTISASSFSGCSGIAEAAFSASIQEIGSWAFSGCSGITEASFASGFAATLDSQAFRSWTFYASDGTTTLDRASASDLAGKTFQGTASALVEVSAGTLSLTPQQIQQVNLHTMEDQDLDIKPMPFQPSVQTQDQEPVSA